MYLLLWHQTWQGSTILTLLGGKQWSLFELAHMSTLSEPILTVIILTALYYFVLVGEGSVASCSMTKIPESQILEKLA